jgi:hypothetical protein
LSCATISVGATRVTIFEIDAEVRAVLSEIRNDA